MGGGHSKLRNAFTLIELLAIIVILAIIAVITVPIILNVIDNAKRGSVIDSAYGYKDAVQKFYVQQLSINPDFKLDGEYEVTNGHLGEYEIPINGTKPTSGKLTYENNILKNGCLVFDDYKVIITNGEFGTLEKGECNFIFKFDKDTIYLSGNAIPNYGGYDWHVIGDDGENVTLLMDAGQLPNMNHCTNGVSTEEVCGYGNYTYKWSDSVIQQYLNNKNVGGFLYNLESKIDNQLVLSNVCNDGYSGYPHSYGGSLDSEINNLIQKANDGLISFNEASGDVSTIKCATYGLYAVRLISESEYYNLSPYYSNDDLFQNVGEWVRGFATISSITRLNNEDSTWLFSNLIGEWWGMAPHARFGNPGVNLTTSIKANGKYESNPGSSMPVYHSINYGVRPVITIKK